MMKTINKLIDAIKDNTFSEKLYKNVNQRRKLFYLEKEEIKAYQISYKVYKKLKKKYSYVLDRQLEDKKRKKGNTIWTLWLQGIDEAPLLCRVCANRIKQVFGEDRVVIITKDNYQKYVNLPDYIIEKWQKGIINNVHFSDIIRINLLVDHGGTWMDTTTLILDKNLPSYFTDSKLFLFANHIDNLYPNIQSSFISAYSNSKLLTYARDLLFEYWKTENYVINYSYFHLFFQMAEEKCKEEWNEIYKYPNHTTHILRKDMYRKFDMNRFNQIKDVCPIQKVTYKNVPSDNIEGTFYDKLILNSKKFFKNR